MRTIVADYGGGTITQPQLKEAFRQWLPNQSAGCSAQLDTFFTQWFDTAYPVGGGPANRPTLTGPGLSGPGFYDDAGACTRADQTIAFAPLAGRAPDAPDFTVAATATSALPVSFAAAGECTVTGTTVHLTGPGSCTITASQPGDGVWKPAEPVARTFAIHRPFATSAAPAVQYSDSSKVTVSATDAASQGSALTATATGLPAGFSLVLVSTSPAGVLPGARTWAVEGIANVAPGSYPVSVTIANDEGGVDTAAFELVVAPEDAEVSYTGDTIVDSTGTLVLRAVVRDSADGEPGDIRKATVRFVQGGTTLCGPVAVELAGEAGTGTATCTASLAPGAHAIEVVVGGWYAGGDEGGIDVGTDDGRIAVAGSWTASNGAGTRKADDGSLTKVDLNIVYQKVAGQKDSLRGDVTIRFDSGGSAWRFDTETLEALGVSRSAGVASLRASVTLTQIVRGKRVVVATGLTLVATFADGPTSDLAGLTVWDGSTLVFSSDWTGTATRERALEHGNVTVK
jgi:hypothetical protein